MIVVITWVQMMARAREDMYSTLEIVQYLGVHRNKTLWQYHHVKPSLWRELKLQNKQRVQDVLSKVSGAPCKKVTIHIDNKPAIALTKNPVFNDRSKHIHRRYHFIRECVENGLIEVEHVPENEQKADILTKALGRINFKEMRGLIGVNNMEEDDFKFRRENVGVSLIKD